VDHINEFRVEYAVSMKNFGYFQTLGRRFGELLRSRRRKSRTALTRSRAAAPRTVPTPFAENRRELGVHGKQTSYVALRCFQHVAALLIHTYRINCDPKTAVLRVSVVKKNFVPRRVGHFAAKSENGDCKRLRRVQYLGAACGRVWRVFAPPWSFSVITNQLLLLLVARGTHRRYQLWRYTRKLFWRLFGDV